MSIALSEEHQELARMARAFLDSHEARAESRALLEEPGDRLASFWKEMAELEWLGLHVDEAPGGQGFAMAPGPFLPGLADGSVLGAVGLGGDLELDTGGKLGGSDGLVLGAELAQLLVVCVGEDVALLEADQPGVTVEPQKNLDPSRRLCAIRCDAVEVAPANLLRAALGPARRWLPSTRRCDSSSAVPSAPSVPSSTTARTCWWRPSRPPGATTNSWSGRTETGSSRP